MQQEIPIDVFYNSQLIEERKTPTIIISWITILFLSTFFILYIAVFNNYHPYLHYYATIIKEEGEYNLAIYMENNQISAIENAYLVIEQQAYPIKIKKILDENDYPMQNNYKTIIISCPIKNIGIENSLLPIQFKLPKQHS